MSVAGDAVSSLAAAGRGELRVESLGFGYRGHRVGREVSFTLNGGELVCLLGPNGGGKTTLFKTLLGLLAPQGGHVMLDGENLDSLSRAEVARRIAYVPQAAAGYFPFTVREVVQMGRTAHLPVFASPTRRDREIADEAIERLGITRLADASYTRISGGERQLALIARALAQRAPLLLMDEPTASLDFGNQVRVLDEVRTLATAGIGVLLSTHDPSHAFRCADRVALMRAGRLEAIGPVRDVLTVDALFALYGVRVRVAEIVDADTGTRDTVCVPVMPVR